MVISNRSTLNAGGAGDKALLAMPPSFSTTSIITTDGDGSPPAASTLVVETLFNAP
jgi:hypothetical protein